MKDMTPPTADLPRTYTVAQAALAECFKIDECKSWSDRAAAMASYARQADDDELYRMAMRIKGRAVRRYGELLKEIEPSKGGRPKTDEGDHTSLRKQAAREAGLSDHQQRTGINVANIPEAEFEEMIESDDPPTVTQLAEKGTHKRENIIDLKGRDPDEFNRALHFVGKFEQVTEKLAEMDIEEGLKDLNAEEIERAESHIIEAMGRLRDAILAVRRLTASE